MAATPVDARNGRLYTVSYARGQPLWSQALVMDVTQQPILDHHVRVKRLCYC